MRGKEGRRGGDASRGERKGRREGGVWSKLSGTQVCTHA